MTRSHKANDPIHSAEPQVAQETLPKNFGKHASHTEAPNRAKKNGGGKANWGRDGDEIIDSVEFSMHNSRRRSNSKGHIEDQFVMSKYEEAEYDEDEVFGEKVNRVDTSSTTSSESTEKSST